MHASKVLYTYIVVGVMDGRCVTFILSKSIYFRMKMNENTFCTESASLDICRYNPYGEQHSSIS